MTWLIRLASPRLRFDLVLNNLVAWAYAKGRVHIKSDGTRWRPIVHVEDISRAFLAVLAAPREVIHNQALNVGLTEENYRIRELAEIVREVVPGSRIEYAKDAGPDPRCYRHAEDSSKLVSAHATKLRAREESAGFNRLETYASNMFVMSGP